MTTQPTKLETQLSSSVIRHTRDLVQGKYTMFTHKLLPKLSHEINNLKNAGVDIGSESLKITRQALSRSLDLAVDLLPEPKPGFEGSIDNIWTAYAFGATGIKGEKLSKQEYNALNALETAIMKNTVIRNVPQLPKIVPQLLKTLKSDSYPWTDFSMILTEDSKFQDIFLTIANSPAFNLSAKANTVEQLFLPFGKEDLKQAVLITAITYVMEYDKGNYAKEARAKNLETAFKTAIACKTLASDGFDIDESNAFITGLTSYVGSVTALRFMRSTDFELNTVYSAPFVARLQQLISLMSYQITLHWKLPKDIRTAIKEQATLGENAKLSTLGEVLFLGTRVGMAHYLNSRKKIKEAKSKVIELVGIDRFAVCETSFETLNKASNYQYASAI